MVFRDGRMAHHRTRTLKARQFNGNDPPYEEAKTITQKDNDNNK